MEDREPIMGIVRSLVYNKNEVALQRQYTGLVSATSPESYATKYPQLVSRLESFWVRREEWALAYRNLASIRGSNTNNIAEAGIRVLKEIVFGRVKAYNLLQMFDFITTTMEIYYANRLLDVAHSRYRPGTLLRYKELDKQQHHIVSVKHVRASYYVVYERKEGQTLKHTVEMEFGICSCPTGSTGAACKHQAAAAKQFKLATANVVPVHSKEMRQRFAIIARGEAQDLQFYADLTESGTGCVQRPLSQPQTDITTSGECTTHSSLDESNSEVQEATDMKKSLYLIVDDILNRLKKGDANLNSGIQKFVRQYKALARSHAPNSAIAYALHNFGKSDSKSLSSS